MRSSPKRITRRRALGLAAGGAIAAPLALRAAAPRIEGAPAPSDRIGLGFIGIGRMGQGHLGLLLRDPQVRVRGVCDVDPIRRRNAQAAVEGAYGAGADCAAHNDLRELLARGDIDAVLIATGDRWHVPAGVLAMKAGKDVYCEKPVSLTIRESRVLREVAARYGRVFQTGLQQRTTLEFRLACDLVRRGRLGKISHVYVCFPGTVREVNLPGEPVPERLDWDLWLGPAPWRPFNHRYHEYGEPKNVVPWHFCPDFGGGNLTSNAVHAFDVVQWGLGMDASGPVEVTPPGVDGMPSLTYRYADGTVLQVEWKLDPRKHFVPPGWDASTAIQAFGAVFVGENGWIHVGREGYLKSHPAEILAQEADDLRAGRPVLDHHKNWLECIRTRRRTACDAAVGGRSANVAHLGGIAHWTGRRLRWDPVKEEFLQDDEANRMRSRPMRVPWRV